MMKKETMLAPDKCLQYGFCDIVGEGKSSEDDPDDLGEGGDPDGNSIPDNDNVPEDDEKQQIKDLQQQLYRQRQINQMLTGLNRPDMKKTLANAFEQFAVK